MTPLAATEAERLEFETWARPWYILDRNEDGSYAVQGAYIAWFAWQAARALQQTAEPVAPFVMETPSGSAEEGLSADEFALFSAMSEISEDRWFAGWMGRNEFDLWSALRQGNSNGYDSELLAYVASMSVKTGKWIIWRDGKDLPLDAHGPYAIPLSDWCAMYAAPDRAPSTVRIPTSADEAQMMASLGLNYLRDNAPERLRAPSTDSATDKRDAARYRAWRDCALTHDEKFMDAMQEALSTLDDEDRNPTVDEWDTAIDAAIAASLPQTKEE